MIYCNYDTESHGGAKSLLDNARGRRAKKLSILLVRFTRGVKCKNTHKRLALSKYIYSKAALYVIKIIYCRDIYITIADDGVQPNCV